MSETTNIEWCDSTFNPWIGCTKVSPACDHCYAERSTPARVHSVAWGAHAERRRTSPANWALPRRWNAQAAAFQQQHGHRQRVFCASLADVFDNQVPDQWRADLYELIAATPNLDWLLLTKRIGNAATMLPSYMGGDLVPNVWLGATICNQEEADRDIPKLLAVPARVRFLSIEPMLGAISFEGMFANPAQPNDGTNALEALDWVICGGESGPGARPMHPDWARDLRDQCAASGTPFLFKQWGEWVELDTGMPQPLVARFGDDEFYDAAMQHDGFLSAAGHFTDHVDLMHDDEPYRGLVRRPKKANGRLLDGRTHDGFPAPAEAGGNG
ncbi:MAG: phage Gp37/Gp68 family protein [Variovorax paradoxus]|nr:MAG: phage Gp37/Gp68 family protein [Variovorax paradoxus]PZQ08967.1 MAG: phage Gp37/Gp68 family protein [Variovorax paradoxus]